MAADPFAQQSNKRPTTVPALLPRGAAGHQFLCYGDSCSGIPLGPHEANFASVNAVAQQLEPPPDFVCFLGDEIRGLLVDEVALREQWRYWLEREMMWLDRDGIPLYHCTANHTTYDRMSERVFCEVLEHLPQNGPPDQERLSYFVRRDDLLLIFVNTMWSGLGGEGRVETTWLEQTLSENADARHKLVLGHHPIFPINGYAGERQRTVTRENGRKFWEVLVCHAVSAYICSHIMAFDVQIHFGVLQILSGGAGTLPLMPATDEYLHCVQIALDQGGIRYQVLDTAGHVREWLCWPPPMGAANEWHPLVDGLQKAPVLQGDWGSHDVAHLVVWRFEGCTIASRNGRAQTFVSLLSSNSHLAPLWIGLLGSEQQVALLLSPEPGRSPRYWLGPMLASGQPFSIQIAIHSGMGPGGMLWRWSDEEPWASLKSSAAWGAERLPWQPLWSIGHDQRGPDGRPFRGSRLHATYQITSATFA